MFFSILVFVFVTAVTMTMTMIRTRNALALALACRSETWMESMTRANISARWVAMVLTRVLHHCCSDGLHQSTTHTIVAMVLIAAIQTVRYTEHSTAVLVKMEGSATISATLCNSSTIKNIQQLCLELILSKLNQPQCW